jgi:hypothetical protein
MRTTATLCSLTAVTLSLASTQVALAASPQEDLVSRWLSSVSFGLPVNVGGSSYDPATQTVTLTDVSIGDPDTDFVRIRFDQLDVEDARLAPHDAFAAHAIRGTNYKVDIHIDVAKWFPGFAKAEDQAAPAKTEEAAPAAGKPRQKPVGVPDSRASSHAGKTPADSSDTAASDEAPAPDAVAEKTEPPVFDYAVSADTLLIERPVIPMPPAPLAADRPFYERAFQLANWYAETRADWLELDSLRLETSGVPEGDAVTTYSMVYVSGMHDGRAERAGLNSMEQKPKTEGSTMPSFTADSAYVIGMDMGAALEALDPARYKDGKGDGKPRTIYSKYGINNIAASFGEGTVSLGNIEANNVFLRQTDQPVVRLITDALANPKSIEEDPFAFMTTVLPNYTQLFGIGNVEANGFEVKVGDSFDFTIRQFSGNGLDANGLDAITLRDIAFNAKDIEARTSLSLLTFQDIRFGSLSSLLALGKSAEEGQAPSAEAIRTALLEGSTSIGFMELGTLAVDSPLGSVSLDTFAVTSGDYLKTLPQRADLTFTSLSLPVSMLTDPDVVTQLTDMGYETLDISGGMTLTWDAERGDVRLEDLTVKATDMGRISADLHIAGLPLSIIDKPDEIEQRFNAATLVDGSITYGNSGIVEKAFEVQAKKLNQDGDTFRKNTAGAMPLMLAFLDDKVLQENFAGPITAFLNDPKSIRISVAPKKPIAFSEFEKVDTSKPGPMIKLLNLNVTANQ